MSEPEAALPDAAQRRRAQLVIVFAIMATGLGQTVVFALLGPLGREVMLTELQIGIIITCSSLVFSVFSPRWGRRSDRVGRKPTMIIGLLGYTAGTVLFATTFWAGLQHWLTGAVLFGALVLARCLQALVMSATSPSATAYMADITQISQRTSGMGMIASAHSIGSILGPACAALAVLGLLAPLYFAATMTLLAAVAVWRWLPSLPAAHARAGKGGSPRLRLTDRRILPFILVGVSLFTAFSMVQQTLGYYFQDVLHLPASATVQQVGIGMMASAFMALFAQLVLVQKFHLHPVTLLRGGLPLIMAGFFLLTLSDQLWMLVGDLALVGLGMGMCGPGFSASSSLAVAADEQGAVAGLISACPALGFILGPVIGGALYQWHATAPCLFASALFIPILVFTWLKVKRV
ncbi:MAG TPA: MFS transporter [Dongiaceae bacterium]|nr:MFS transporter [Dongiaceae bacterium]